MTSPKLSVVVPCYNEAGVLAMLRLRLTAVCRTAVGDDFEVILVDDGSSDDTRAIIRAFHAEDQRFKGVLLSRNRGHQIALSAGLDFARGERILIIDADLQDPPELLVPMMALMDQGYDVVYGQRASRAGETAFKKYTASLFYRVFRRLADLDMPVDTGDFRLMSRRALDAVLSMPEQHRCLRAMVSWVGFRQAPIVYDRDERLSGESKYPLRKMLAFALDAITGFSTVPLRIATGIGLVFGLSSIPVAIYVMSSWVAGAAVPGWTSVMMLMLMIGGTQLMVMGIFGEYLGRLYMQAKNRPLCVIEEVLAGRSVPQEAGPQPGSRPAAAAGAGAGPRPWDMAAGPQGGIEPLAQELCATASSS